MARRPARHRVDGSTRRGSAAAFAARLEARVCFTHDQARRALIFLRPVLIDLCAAFAEACACRERLRSAPGAAPRSSWVSQQERAIARFDRALDDVESVGAEVICCESGRLAFPTLVDSRPARLTWSLQDEVWSCATPLAGGAESGRAEPADQEKCD